MIGKLLQLLQITYEDIPPMHKLDQSIDYLQQWQETRQVHQHLKITKEA